VLKKTIVVSALALAASGAFAKDYGKYLCEYGCEYFPLSLIDVRNFVSMFVNQDVEQWKKNDTFSICNGATCGKYITYTHGITWNNLYQYPDNGPPYKGYGGIF